MKRMLINMSDPEECRIAVMDGPRLTEYYFERTSAASQVGNIYKGVVANVEPGLQAAFVDFGGPKNGFLHVSEVDPRAAGGRSPEKAEKPEKPEKEGGRREDRPIQTMLKRGQEVIVQVIREAIDHKGASLTMRLSLPGRYLVLMPGIEKVGVSRKITDVRIRDKLREALAQLKPPKGLGFIIRTAGIDRTQEDLSLDLKYLLRLWDIISRRAKRTRGAASLYQESDLVIRVIRDIFSADMEEIVVDSAEADRRVKEFLRAVMPRYQSRVRLYAEKEPLFHHHRIEEEVEQLYSPRVPLKLGGSLVIEQTEALVAIDVNSGRYKEEDDVEETVYRTNLEAAREIPRQLKLRDLGGLVVCDFIDMEQEKHVREVERQFEEEIRRDRARVRVARMSPFGVIELTRQKVRAGTERLSHENCPVCGGTGRVKTPESIALKVLRQARTALLAPQAVSVQLRLSLREANYLLTSKKKALGELEQEFRKRCEVSIDPALPAGSYEIRPLAEGGRPL